jgi:hypothetical protein
MVVKYPKNHCNQQQNLVRIYKNNWLLTTVLSILRPSNILKLSFSEDLTVYLTCSGCELRYVSFASRQIKHPHYVWSSIYARNRRAVSRSTFPTLILSYRAQQFCLILQATHRWIRLEKTFSHNTGLFIPSFVSHYSLITYYIYILV